MNNFSTKTASYNYVIGLLILGIVSFGSYFSLYRIISIQKDDAGLINIAGRQRMLSQCITLSTERLVSEKDPSAKDLIREKLKGYADQMESSHDLLIAGKGAVKPLSPEARAIYFSPPLSLDNMVKVFIGRARALSASTDDEGAASHIKDIRASSGDLLAALDRVVVQYQKESESSVEWLQIFAAVLLAVNISTLVIIAVFVFRPMLTEMKQSVDMLKETNSLLQIQAEELKENDRRKNEFVSIVSHELRTPLTSIRASLGLIAGGVMGKMPEQVCSLLNIAVSNTDRLVRLINNVLDIEKIESGGMPFHAHPMELMPIIENAVDSTKSYAYQRGITISVSHCPQIIKVFVDSDRLSQVLTNLISNAIKFSPLNAVVEISVERDEGSVRVSVKDSGPGITEEFRGRIFQKFAQADSSNTRKQGGTGLGLSISKSIIERLGGRIGFTSDPGKGAIFYFDLPEWVESDGLKKTPALETLEPIDCPRIIACENNHFQSDTKGAVNVQ